MSAAGGLATDRPMSIPNEAETWQIPGVKWIATARRESMVIAEVASSTFDPNPGSGRARQTIGPATDSIFKQHSTHRRHTPRMA